MCFIYYMLNMRSVLTIKTLIQSIICLKIVITYIKQTFLSYVKHTHCKHIFTMPWLKQNMFNICSKNIYVYIIFKSYVNRMMIKPNICLTYVQILICKTYVYHMLNVWFFSPYVKVVRSDCKHFFFCPEKT
jgi:hypothetical protein